MRHRHRAERSARHEACELLSTPGVPTVVVATLIGRLPLGMMPLTLVLLSRAEGGSYAASGGIVAAFTLGITLCGPGIAAAADRLGASAVLRPLAVAFPLASLGVLASIAARTPFGVALAGAFLTGGSLPPLGACMRALWPRLVQDPDRRSRAYAFEATAQQAPAIAGPFMVAGIAHWASPSSALVVAALAGALGALLFSRSPALPADDVPARHVTSRRSIVLRSSAVRTLLLTSGLMAVCSGALTIAFPAFAESHDRATSAGVIFGAWAAGSVCGGLATTLRNVSTATPRAYVYAIAASAAAMSILPLVPGIQSMVFAAWLIGVPTAPALASAYGLLSRYAASRTLIAAFAWLNSAITTGAAIGTVFAGELIHRWGPLAGFLLAMALGWATLAVALLKIASLERHESVRADTQHAFS